MEPAEEDEALKRRAKKSHGWGLGRLVKNVLGAGDDPAAAEAEAAARRARHRIQQAEVDAFLTELRSIEWLPTCREPPVAGMPWTSGRQLVAAPNDTRPATDAW